jgi:hypothetical protein
MNFLASTWSGRVVSKVLKAQLTVDEFQTSVMDSHQLQELVERRLFAEMTDSIIKEMTIENIGNPNIGMTTYTGTLNVGANTITTIRTEPELNLRDLRVVEFTKKGKVTKVELQYYTEGGWLRIPRVQIEEK